MDIGPILGILSIPRPGPNPFVGGQNEAFPEILMVAERMNCIAFVFSPFDLDWSRNAVWGYRYNWKNQPGEWERHLFPLPSVIYNRIPNRTIENRGEIKNILAVIKQKYGPRIFNPFFLDKWDTHLILCNSKDTSRFLPETRRLTHPKVIDQMLNRYNSVYIKPTANSLGNEILKVYRRDQGQYYFIHQSLGQQPREGLAFNCGELVVEWPASEEGTEYLVQQAIPLAEVEGRPFDLRLLVQKNRQGTWHKTGTAARLAGTGRITTHVFYGGTQLPAAPAIREAARHFRFSHRRVYNQLKKLQLKIPQIIEKAYGESFGELEMDVGIDQMGKVWFFEANSKPFRFDEKLIRAKSLVRLIHYVRYLDAQDFNNPADGRKQHGPGFSI